MRKVAETAGVSMATVSRVLNGSGPVNAQAAERVRAAIASLKYQPNRAARTLASSRSAFIGLLIARNIPIVAVDQPIRDPSIDSVRIDNITAAKETVAHLIANGYRRIGVISGPKSTSTANERVLGYRQALQEAGIKHDPVLEH